MVALSPGAAACKHVRESSKLRGLQLFSYMSPRYLTERLSVIGILISTVYLWPV